MMLTEFIWQFLNPLSADPTIWSNTLKQFLSAKTNAKPVGIFWGWRLKRLVLAIILVCLRCIWNNFTSNLYPLVFKMQNIHGLWDIENNFLYEIFQNLGLEIYFSSFSNFYLRTFMFRFKEFLVLFWPQ